MKFKLTMDANSSKRFEFANQIQDWEATNANSAAFSAKWVRFPFETRTN
jgi:hypothetical protein